MKAGLWRSDGFLGIVLTLAMLVVSGSAPWRSLERQAYDLGLRWAARPSSDQVAVIAIDEESLAEFGPWPWPPDLLARLVDLLAGAPAKVVGTTVLFTGPQGEPDPEHSRRLAQSLAGAGNVVLPLRFAPGDTPVPGEVPSDVAASRLAKVEAGKGRAVAVSDLRPPLALLADKARAFGHLNWIADDDGRVRSDALAVRYGDQFYPSLALTLAASSRDVAPGEIRGRTGESLQVAGSRIPVDAMTRLHSFFYRGAEGHSSFPLASFSAVVRGEVPAAAYAGKIVLVGVTAPAVETPLATPVGAMAPVLLVAHALSGILQEDFIVIPEWGVWLGWAALPLTGLYLAVVLPALGGGGGVLASLLLLLGLLGVPFVLLLGAGVWLPLTSAAVLLLCGHLALTLKRWMAGRRKPALSGADPAFRDIASRRAYDKGTSGGLTPRTVIGRYQLEKVLDKGAMGIVYLGRDAESGRRAAIKTLALAREFDAGELVEVKQRLFREAEMVARLDHPNIVALYEAGEEQDLAYIAMEFLPGQNLLPWCQPETRLPLATVLSIVARVADALDYAHGLRIVHRDIKPANIVYAAESDRVKVADFGVAGLTDSSLTKTGMLLGTPSYMSPEQLAGEKLDGRSDIYSLGVTLYQLCCGQLPFTGASLAELMFRIANEPAPDIRGIAPALPPELAAVIAKAMAKRVDQRYPRAAELAADLRRCRARLNGDGGA